jgi:hypothetical protein
VAVIYRVFKDDDSGSELRLRILDLSSTEGDVKSDLTEQLIKETLAFPQTSDFILGSF